MLVVLKNIYKEKEEGFGIKEQTKSVAEINNDTVWIGLKGKAIKGNASKGEEDRLRSF